MLQLQPLNHGKNVRLELLATEIVNNIRGGGTNTRHNEISRDLKIHCTKHWAEDPPEEFFTENIVFVNGNNIVYPGIYSDCTEIVQGLLHSLLDRKKLPNDYVHEVSEASLFILHVQNTIAEKLGHTHRMFEESDGKELFIPNEAILARDKELFSFDQDQLEAISDNLNIPVNTIRNFTYEISHKINAIEFDDSNPLFLKPFIELDGQFFLVMPTALLCALCEFIVEKAREYSCLDELLSNFSNEAAGEIDMILGMMGWRKVDFDFITKPPKVSNFGLVEEMWQFDTNKLAYVPTIIELPKTFIPRDEMEKVSKEFEARVKAIAEAFHAKNPDGRLMVVGITLKTSVLQRFMMSCKDIKYVDQEIVIPFYDLQCLTRHWHFEPLTLWKYVKYLDLSRAAIMFSPMNSHLSKFNWYQRNHEAFNDSDERPFNFAAFELDIEGNIKREAKAKIDRVGIPFTVNGVTGFVRCRRKEEHYPVYISDEIRSGYLRSCLLGFSCPIWIQGNQSMDYTADIYINAILFWLYRGYDVLHGFINQLRKRPIVITLHLDTLLSRPEEWEFPDVTQEIELSYNIIPTLRAVEIKVPFGIVDQLSRVSNEGEQTFMKHIIHIIGDLIEQLGLGTNLTEEELDATIKEIMPSGNEKMIIMAQSDRDISLSATAIRPARKIPKSEISYILNNQVSWLGYTKEIPRKIASASVKISLLNDLVKVHFKQVIDLVNKYDAVQLLVYLMQRHENTLHERAFRKITYPAKAACYGSFIDVQQQYIDTEADLVSSSLALRTLIEFVACEMPGGKSIPNDDDIDLMLAHVSELVNYGAMSDTIKFEIYEPEIGLLPSGRIGIGHEFADTTLRAFRDDIYIEEYERHITEYAEHFYDPEQKKPDALSSKEDPYWDKVDAVFRETWGITIWDILGASNFIGWTVFSKNESVAIMSHEELKDLFTNRSNLSNEEFAGFLKVLSFEERKGILGVDAKDLPEVYPWRYNRRVSYMLKPIVPVKLNEQQFYLISVRHLYTAAQNIIARFFDGTLKTGKQDFKIQNLLAQRNDIKGKAFRDKVCNWLKENTTFEVYPYEVKIKPKAFFKSECDKGDIDILAIDHQGKILYSIECKNTSQAKIAYDIHAEISNYLGRNGKEGMIEKHVRRDQWLNENKEDCLSTLGLTKEYAIKSIVITKNILPTKYIKETKLPMFSFADLLQNRVFMNL
ncbi:MAG TPA: hypothetical protein VGE44_00355 [Daejeonella sp.]|uniref:hypothetical protein n=1 Tax=Daejeonella sp. TaxID=2805397 RepID=UPI002EDA21CE